MINIPLRKKILIPLLIASLFTLAFIYYLYAHSSLPPAIVEPGSMVTEADYIIFTDGAGNYYARNGKTGKIEFSGTDASTVIQSAINNLSFTGGIIFLKPGKYYINSTITLGTDGLKLIGSGGWGDFHLTSDGVAGFGFYPRNLTLLIDNTTSGLDPVIQVGTGDADNIIKGVHIKRLAITGKESWTGDTDWKGGSGIKTRSARAGCIIEEVSVYRKQYGIVLGIKNGTPNYLYNNEGMIIRDILFAYNENGLYLDSGASLYDSTIENIRGYYNYRGLVRLQNGSQVSHVSLRNISGQMCGYESASAGIGLRVTGMVTLENAWIDNNYGNSYAGFIGIYAYFATPGQESVLNIISPTIHGVKKGIYLGGDPGKYGTVNIVNPYIGISYNSTNAPLGGKWGVTEKGVDNGGSATLEVHIRGGTIRVSTYDSGTGGQKDVADKYGEGWFYRIQTIRDVRGYNPTGLLTYPWNNYGGTVGLYGYFGHSLEPNRDYQVAGVDIIISSSGGTGVNITIKDPAGNIIKSGLTSLTAMYLPVGYKINFGNFSSAPTVTVSGN